MKYIRPTPYFVCVCFVSMVGASEARGDPKAIETVYSAIRPLIDVTTPDAKWSMIVKPIRAEGKLWTVGYSKEIPGHPSSAQLLAVDLESGHTEVVNSIPLESSADPSDWFSARRWMSGGMFNVCLPGTDLFSFPCDGKPVTQVTFDHPSPVNFITQVARVGDSLLMASGVEDQEGQIAFRNLKSKKVTVVASSKEQNSKSPFDGAGPFVVAHLIADPSRQRFVFFIYSHGWDDSRRGIWEFKSADLKFRKLHPWSYDFDPTTSSESTDGSVVEGDVVVMRAGGNIVAYDLKMDQEIVADEKHPLPHPPAQNERWINPVVSEWSQAYGDPGMGASDGDGTIAQRVKGCPPLAQLSEGVLPRYVSALASGELVIGGDEGLWALTPRQ